MSSDSPEVKRSAEEVLRRYWKHGGFREGQWEVIEAALAGRDVLAVLPTGAGKSVCYQVPAVLEGGLTLVVSPLVALMQDQVAALTARGIPAAFINSTLSGRMVEQRWTDAEFGRYRLLYVSPERLQSELFLARAARLPVRRLVVDEAHCISEWGHHFRPAYLKIAEAAGLMGGPPVLAVTATATPEVRRDIVEHLGLRAPAVLVRGFDRPNIIWSVFRGEEKRAKVLDVAAGVEGTGILYASTRARSEAWAGWLTAQGHPAAAYHAGMTSASRASVQEAWQEGAVRLVAATSAFGMGIDKPDVRFVVHAEPPPSLEAYYQEAGRAGRDGQRAYAVLLFDEQDAAGQRRLLKESHPDAAAVRAVYDAVGGLGRVAVGDCPEGPVSVSVEAVARATGFGAGRIRAAVDLLVRQGVWTTPSARRHHVHVRFRQPARAVRQYAGTLGNEHLAAFISKLLRALPADAYQDWWQADMRRLERRLKVPPERLMSGFEFLRQRGIIDWFEPTDELQVLYTEARAERIPVDEAAVRRALRRAEARLEDMLRFARSVTCRRHFLLSYFGEESPPRCGRCDYCLGRSVPVAITPEDEPLMRRLLEHFSRSAPEKGAPEVQGLAPERLNELIQWLVQEAYIRADGRGGGGYVLTEKGAEVLEQWKPREYRLISEAEEKAARRRTG